MIVRVVLRALQDNDDLTQTGDISPQGVERRGGDSHDPTTPHTNARGDKGPAVLGNETPTHREHTQTLAATSNHLHHPEELTDSTTRPVRHSHTTISW